MVHGSSRIVPRTLARRNIRCPDDSILCSEGFRVRVSKPNIPEWKLGAPFTAGRAILWGRSLCAEPTRDRGIWGSSGYDQCLHIVVRDLLGDFNRDAWDHSG